MNKPQIFFYLPEHNSFNHFVIFFLNFFEQVREKNLEAYILYEPLIDIYKTNRAKLSGKKDEFYFKKLDLSWYSAFDTKKYEDYIYPSVKTKKSFWDNGQKIKTKEIKIQKEDIIIIPETHVNEIPNIKKLGTKIFVVVFNYSMLANQEYFFYVNNENIDGFIVTDNYIKNSIEKLGLHDKFYLIHYPIIIKDNEQEFYLKKPYIIINNLYYNNNVFFQSVVKSFQYYMPQYLFIKFLSSNNLNFDEYKQILKDTMFLINFDNMNSFNPVLIDAIQSNISILTYKQNSLDDYINIYNRPKIMTFNTNEIFEICHLIDEFIYQNTTSLTKNTELKIDLETFKKETEEFLNIFNI